ncbi:GlcG/HbpS family heme-binding protein [Streptomyces sp. x-80]|uniref:GlcG/HbpS family heme-binding protein n=1 Tax=Streptomyces sp. x-80 TaxID=2789282 RepID=UPI00397F6B25
MKKMSHHVKVLTCSAAAAVIAAGTFSAVSATASAAAPKVSTSHSNLTASSHLSITAAAKAAQAVLDAARKDGQKLSVAVVDRNGNTIVTMRGDGAGPQSYESAVKKAYTAVSWNAPTSRLVKSLDKTPNLKDIPGTLFLAGGAPIQSTGAPVAGIGVGGASSGDQDEKFAQEGVAALGR